MEKEKTVQAVMTYFDCMGAGLKMNRLQAQKPAWKTFTAKWQV